MNKSIMSGNLIRDPVLNTAEGKTSVVNFRIAVSRKYKNENGELEADYFSCVAFGKTAEFIAQYFKQGQPIIMSGRMQNDNYINRNGEKVYGVKLIIEDVDFAGSKKENEDGSTRENERADVSSRNNQSQANARPQNQRNTSPISSYSNNRTARKPQRSQASRPGSQNRSNVDEEFMNAGNEYMEDFF